MKYFVRALPTVLLHVNLLLMLYSGATLLTAARLKWDPTAYIAARELFPMEYRSAAVLLPLVGFTLLALAHVALAALRCRHLGLRRVLLTSYTTFMLIMMWIEVVWATWVAWRVKLWTRGPQASELRHAFELTEHIHPLLQHLSHYHPLPEKVNQLMKEAEADLPRNWHVFLWAGGILATLQATAAVLALAGAATTPRRPTRRYDPLSVSTATTTTPLSSRRVDSDKTPLKAAYKNRLVIV